MPLRGIKVPPPVNKGDKNASQQLDLDRPTANEIFEQVSRNAHRELKRSSISLAVAGVVGGLTMGLTGLSVSAMTAQLGGGKIAETIGLLFYPLGFLAVILGRGQLFTENTLYPVALIMSERRHVWNTVRLWSIVLPTNLAGALGFAFLAVRTRALDEGMIHALAQLGVAAASPSVRHIYWSGVIGGWIIAFVAWLVSGSHSITGSFAVIWIFTFIVGLGHFAHCIATSGEIMSAVLAHALPWHAYLRWIVPAVLGNVTGGVVLVTLLEYGQTKLD
jgi:formate/nitrite transporter FocA (FNT family)